VARYIFTDLFTLGFKEFWNFLERLVTSSPYQKTVNASYLIGIAGVIAMPDIVFGLLVELTHTLIELAHLLFEVFEAALDHSIEHIFHTDTHETQIIVFYFMLSMAFGGLYYLWWTMPRFFRTLKENILQRKSRFLLYWAESAANKFKLIALFHAGLTYLVVFGF
jgi:hypothetical protein